MHIIMQNAHSYAMMLHGMNMIKNATEHLNQGQITVVIVDVALYPLIKKMQWTWPAVYGETKFVMMMGGLHIEMSFLAAIGKWLEGSGWTSVKTTGGVTTEGRAIGLEKGSKSLVGSSSVPCCSLYVTTTSVQPIYGERGQLIVYE